MARGDLGNRPGSQTSKPVKLHSTTHRAAPMSAASSADSSQYRLTCSRPDATDLFGAFISTMQTPGQCRSMKPAEDEKSSNRAPTAPRSEPYTSNSWLRKVCASARSVPV